MVEKKALKLATEREIANRDPFWLIESGYLRIKTKSGDLKPLVMKRAQNTLHALIKDLWDNNKIIRLFILKARQTGITTYVQALIYSIVSHTPNINAVDIADDVDGANYIFNMSKFYHEKTPDHLKIPLKKSNEKKLEFDGISSQILVDTATNKDAGRKFTFRIAHLSEYAFYRDPSDLMLGLSQSVPSLPRTIIIKESTANGFNFAKEEWDKIEAGESDYIGVFIPWYWDDDYQMDATDNFVIGDSSVGEASEDERMLVDRMIKDKVDNHERRLAWRRWCIRNNCGNGSDKQRIANFKQEYPSTPEEAFKASGDCYFDQDELVRQKEKCTAPKFLADIVTFDGKYELRESSEGVFKFFEEPSKYVQYVVGGDAASGSGTDYSALVARRKDTNKVVATMVKKIDSDELAYKAMLLGGLLNNATVAIENDRFGYAANMKLKTMYKNIYRKKKLDTKTNKETESYGWDTNSVTRPIMLSQMQQEIRQQALFLEDEALIKQCMVFINHESGKPQAQEGCNDDIVMACAISGMVRILEPIKTLNPARESKYRINALESKKINSGFGF